MKSLSVEERLSKNLSQMLTSKIELTELEQAKIEYGFSVFLINLFKVAAIYFVSFLLHALYPTLLMHVSFCILRRYCNGFHARSSLNCLIVSVTCFSLIPWFIYSNHLVISPTMMYLTGALCGIILFFYAPADTKKNPITCRKKRMQLKVKSLGMLLLLMLLLTFFFNGTERLLGISGILGAALFTLPIEKILWRNEG